jgi:putative SOS response-associated peptidase YedK
MCGRIVTTITAEILKTVFSLQESRQLEPHYNVIPSQLVPVVRNQGDHNRLDLLKWGLVPAWAKDSGVGSHLINAHYESVFEKPAYRHALKYRRCIIPVSGFYEWQEICGEHRKQPWYIRMNDDAPMYLAGLWESWKTRDGSELESFAVVTTSANSLVAPIHDRMPVIVHPDNLNLWLSHNMHDPELLLPLYQPFSPAGMNACRVSELVNNPHNDSPACIVPVTVSAG